MEIVSKSHPTSLVVVDLREILADFCWDGDFGEGPLIFRLFFGLLDNKTQFSACMLSCVEISFWDVLSGRSKGREVEVSTWVERGL